MYFDTHTHLLDEKFDSDRKLIVEELGKHSVIGVMECATDLDTSKLAVDFANSYENIYAAIGVHPHDAKIWDDESAKILSLLLNNEKVCAVGEIGLDYYYDFSPRDTQRKVFEAQMDFAQQNGIPVVIHSRDAFADTLSVIKNFPKVKGIWHSFTGSVEILEEAIELDYFIAFGGVITFKNAKKPANAAKAVPLDRFVIETDCPYMTPVPHRGKRNEPKYVKYVAQKIAELKGLEPRIIEEAALLNTKKALNIEF